MAQWVDLKVGFSCNNHCIHCVVSDKYTERDLYFYEIENILENYINQYKTINLTLTGGEITCRDDFFNIIDYISSLKKDGKIKFVDMQTNARLLSNISYFDAITNTIDFFLIAVHGNDGLTHDKITQVDGSFHQTVAAIERIVSKCGPQKIAIQTVINKVNYNKLKNICKYFCEQFSIREFNITFPHPVGICYNTNIVPRYQEVQQYINEAIHYCLENDINPFLEALPYCIFDEIIREYAINFYREREINVVGFAGEKDGYIDYQEVSEKSHGKYASCTQCKFYNICNGIWNEYLDLYPNDNLVSLIS